MILFFLGLILLGLIVWIAWQSQYLRPSGDDYCFGEVVANYGLYGGVVHWWNTWSGFLYMMFSGNLFVGLPLAFLPIEVASAAPFLAAAFGMAATFLFMQKRSSDHNFFNLFLVLIIIFCWWTFLWASPLLRPRNYLLIQFANGLTHWQTLNGQYILVLEVLLLGFASIHLLFLRNLLSFASRAIWTALLGILAGSVGTTLSLSILIVSIIAIFFGLTPLIFPRLRALCRGGVSKINMQFFGILFTFTLLSMLICHLAAPGTFIRAQAINPNYSLSIDRILHVTSVTLFDGFRAWRQQSFNYGTLIVLALVSGAYFLGHKACWISSHRNSFKWTALFLTCFALLQCFINRLSEEFTYQAYWHYTSALVCTFLSVSFFGAYLGSRLAAMNIKYLVKIIFIIIFIISVGLGITANLLMVKVIHERHVIWSVGPAPLEGISDIDGPSGWQMDCWKKLNSSWDNPISR